METARVFALRVRKKGWPDIGQILRPAPIDLLLFAAQPNSPYRPSALVPFEISRRFQAGSLCYEARCGDTIVHRSWVRDDVLLPVQFGYSHGLVVGGAETKVGYRGLRIAPDVLSFLTQELQGWLPGMSIFILVAPVDRSSIRSIEYGSYQYVARLRGLRVGLWILNRSGQAPGKEIPDGR